MEPRDFLMPLASRKIIVPRITNMENLLFLLIVQLNLVFGVAGLLWPEKFLSVYGILMFPWPATNRAIRTHGIVSIAGYLLVVARLVLSTHFG